MNKVLRKNGINCGTSFHDRLSLRCLVWSRGMLPTLYDHIEHPQSVISKSKYWSHLQVQDTNRRMKRYLYKTTRTCILPLEAAVIISKQSFVIPLWKWLFDRCARRKNLKSPFFERSSKVQRCHPRKYTYALSVVIRKCNTVVKSPNYYPRFFLSEMKGVRVYYWIVQT